MSFDEDPYKHVAVTYDHEKGIGWECNSCGADSHRGNANRKAEVFTARTPVIEIMSSFWNHVMQSHHYTREDTKDWA